MTAWLLELLEAYGWIVLFCLGCGLFSVAFVPLLLLMERLEDEYLSDEGGEW